MSRRTRSHDPEKAAEELDRKRREEEERVKEAEEARFTTRQEQMHRRETPEDEHQGKKTSQDYA